MNTHSAAPGRSSGQSIELYEREYVPTVARPMAYSLLAVAQPRSHEQVLDVAAKDQRLGRDLREHHQRGRGWRCR